MRDLPPVRHELMRHGIIQTTLPYYVGAERREDGGGRLAGVFEAKW